MVLVFLNPILHYLKLFSIKMYNVSFLIKIMIIIPSNKEQYPVGPLLPIPLNVHIS